MVCCSFSDTTAGQTQNCSLMRIQKNLFVTSRSRLTWAARRCWSAWNRKLTLWYFYRKLLTLLSCMFDGLVLHDIIQALNETFTFRFHWNRTKAHCIIFSQGFIREQYCINVIFDWHFLCSEQILFLTMMVEFGFPLSTTRVTGIVAVFYWTINYM